MAIHQTRPQPSQEVPVLILGGQENALSIARSLTRYGVTVRLSAGPGCWALRSRYPERVYRVPSKVDEAVYWEDLLLGEIRQELRGSVLFAGSDKAIEFLANRRGELGEDFLLDDHVASQQLQMLDKLATLELARELGVPTPGCWEVKSIQDLEAIEGYVEFPTLIKPVHSHRFQEIYRKKLLFVENPADLRAGVKAALDRGLAITICEMIPGPDTLLSSYYTYITPGGDHLFHFTKRVLRRSPPNFGGGSYHITEWVPDTADLGTRFFTGIGFRGLGNVEFKRDPRDGRLKLIECNARFTAAQELLVRAGMDIAWIIYRHLIGDPLPETRQFREGYRLWYPFEDFNSFRSLWRSGNLSFPGWLLSVAKPQVFPYFDVRDPMPAMAKARNTFRTRIWPRLRPITRMRVGKS